MLICMLLCYIRICVHIHMYVHIKPFPPKNDKSVMCVTSICTIHVVDRVLLINLEKEL